MKLFRNDDSGHFNMVLDEDEWEGFKDVLSLYPCTPSGHHSLSSKDHPEPELKDSDQWLKESTEMHQGDRLKQIKVWLNSIKKNSNADESNYTVPIDPDRADWLIEILNDVRVGNWLKLGCPSPESLDEIHMGSDDWPSLWAMEISGMFQSVILKCLMS